MIAPVLLGAAAAAVLVGLPGVAGLDRLVVRARQPMDLRLVLLGVVAVLTVSLGIVGVALALVLAVVARRAWLRRLADRARERERASAVEALAVLGSELRAGRPSADALEAAAGVAVGALAAVLLGAASGQRFGADASVALARAAEGTATPEMLRGLAACWQVCSSTGSSLAAAVDRLTEALRAEREQRLAVAAELAGPRATAGLLAGLPLLGIALAAGLGARPIQVLLHTPVGIGCLVGGVALDLVGLWWTGRIVAAAGGSG